MGRIDWDPVAASVHEPQGQGEGNQPDSDSDGGGAGVATFSGEDPLAEDFDLQDVVSGATQSPRVQNLMRRARLGTLPLDRPLEYYEPRKLNSKHMSCIMLKAVGYKQNRIAELVDYDQGTVSKALNHPYAIRILATIHAESAKDAADIQKRLKKRAPSMVGVIEDVVFDEKTKPATRASNAFKWLELAGYGAAQKHEHKHEGQITVSDEKADQLREAIAESRQIEEADYVVLGDEAREDRALGGGGNSLEGPASSSGSLPPGASNSPQDQHPSDQRHDDSLSPDSGSSVPDPRVSTSDTDEEAA